MSNIPSYLALCSYVLQLNLSRNINAQQLDVDTEEVAQHLAAQAYHVFADVLSYEMLHRGGQLLFFVQVASCQFLKHKSNQISI